MRRRFFSERRWPGRMVRVVAKVIPVPGEGEVASQTLTIPRRRVSWALRLAYQAQ